MGLEHPQPGLDDLGTLRAVWDAVADGLALSAPDGKVLAVNDAYCSLYGFTPEELVGRSFALIFPEPARAQAELEYRAIFEQGTPLLFESSVRSAAQTDLVVEARASFIKRNGRSVAMLSMIRDVTAQRRAEAERELFIASASHDLLQPLARIKGRAQLLFRRVGTENLTTEGLQAGLRAIVTAVDDVTDQLALLVDGARRRAGQPPLLQQRSVELTTLVADLVALHQSLNETHNFQYDAPPPPLVGTVDETRVRRVIGNLLSNAVKYSTNGSDVLVRLTTRSRVEGLEAILEIQDHGVGIPVATCRTCSSTITAEGMWRTRCPAPGWASPVPLRSSSSTAVPWTSRAKRVAAVFSGCDCRFRPHQLERPAEGSALSPLQG